MISPAPNLPAPNFPAPALAGKVFAAFARLAAGGALLAAAACALPGPPGRGDARPAGRPAAGAAPAAPADSAAPSPGRRAALPAPDVAVPAPSDLIGRTSDSIERTLGAPVFVRRDPPAEFWRYRHASCVLELIFYERDGAQRLGHMETRAGGADEAASARCLRALVLSRPAPRG